jgi:Terminase large subunit, T4likevirus-type, N-terminal
VTHTIYNRIDRTSDEFQEIIEKTHRKNEPIISSGILEFFEQVAGFKPTKYQERLLLDPNQFVVCRWCRQSGKSLSIGVICLHTALSAPNRRIVIIAPSFRQSRRMIRRISSFLPRLPSNIIAGRPLKTKLEFINGSVIEAFPNNPEGIRGETCNMVLLDEAGYVKDDRDLYDSVVYSLSTTNGRLIASSTPGSMNSLFYGMCTDDDLYRDYSRHHVTYLDALEPNGPLKKDTVEKLEFQMREDPFRWRREMLAEFAEDEESWLSYSLITSCIDPSLEYYTEEQIKSLPNIEREDPMWR